VLPRVGVSACLLGEKVRYDGGHKRQDDLLKRLESRVEWVSVCPEAELGLGVPRETIGLEAIDGGVRLIANRTRRDLTDSMRDWARTRLDQLDELCGFVFKARSPSCALRSAPVQGETEPSDGVWAESVRSRFPWLPLADETQLDAAASAEHFLFRAQECRGLNELFREKWTSNDLVEFHTSSKLLLLAHSPEAYAALGRMVSHPRPTAEFEAAYRVAYMAAVGTPPTPGREANALAHAFGYFSEKLPPEERQALASQIDAVARGAASADDLKRRLRAEAERFQIDYLVEQRYLG